MRKTLGNMLKNTFFKIGLAGSLGLSSLLYGCSEAELRRLNGADLLSLGAGLSSIAPNSDLTIPQREALGYISGFAGEQGRRMHEMDVAEESGDEIYINTVPQNNSTSNSTPVRSIPQDLMPEYDLEELDSIGRSPLLEPGKINYIFTYSKYGDFNGDGHCSINEFIIKRNFYEGEQINVAICYTVGAQLSYLEFKVTDERGVVYDLEKGIYKSEKNNPKKLIIRFPQGNNDEPGIYDIKCTLKTGNEVEHKGGVFQVLKR